MSTNVGQSNHTFLEGVTSANTSKELNVISNFVTANIEITGTATSFNIVFEAQVLNSNQWHEIVAVNLKNLNIDTKATEKGIYQLDLTGLTKVRTRLTSISGGNLTVKGRVVS